MASYNGRVDGANANFRDYEPDQNLLLPPSLAEWLPANHVAYFIRDVLDQMDLSEFYSRYDSSRGGQPAYEPSMMLGLLILAYSGGLYSSRKIEKATYESIPFRVLSANQHPDHDTIASFRRRHLKAFSRLFLEILRLCQQAGLVKLGHIALDGTKLHANASKHKAMSYQRVKKKEAQLEIEIQELLQQAEAADSQEDSRYGAGVGGDDIPEELAFRQKRLERIKQAKAVLERRAAAEAQDEEEAKKAAKSKQHNDKDDSDGNEDGAPVPATSKVEPDPKSQINFTDVDSRIMFDHTKKAFEQSYNCQAAVDEKAQVIVAAAVSQEGNDKRQLQPMIEAISDNTGGQLPKKVSADTGYYSDANVASVADQVDLYVATKRQKHDQKPMAAPQGRIPQAASRKDRMQRKLQTKAGQAVYKKRKEIVEPVFGQIKGARGFRQFSLRGLDKVSAEWDMICAVHNLLKLFTNGWIPN